MYYMFYIFRERARVSPATRYPEGWYYYIYKIIDYIDERFTEQSTSLFKIEISILRFEEKRGAVDYLDRGLEGRGRGRGGRGRG